MSDRDTPTVLLEGIDGGTPLGFLAAIGLQRTLADRADEDAGAPPPRLSWKQLDGWRPQLHGPASLEAVADTVQQDVQAWKDEPILWFRYLKLEKNGAKEVGALRAPLAVFHEWLLERRLERDETSLSYAQALMTETASETLKAAPAPKQFRDAEIPLSEDAPLHRSTERTFFDFTSRNVQFLEQVAVIRRQVTPETILDALSRGAAQPDGRTLDWDLASDVPGSIYTGYSRGYLPVHEWLAFRALVCFPIAGLGTRVRTTACTGRRLRGAFLWPLWEVPANPDAVRSLVARPDLAGLSSAERAALGISVLLKAELTKKADGYTGIFAPPGPV